MYGIISVWSKNLISPWVEALGSLTTCTYSEVVKCYMQQLLSGLQHCHERGILHRDIKGSNLLIDKDGMLKIADFGLANYYNPQKRKPLTNRVVTLWYRAPELLLGTTSYGPGIDLWSAGCLMAEMFLARPILPGRTEVEQLHKIFKLCGTPPEEYWKKLRVSTTFRPPHSYKPNIREAFRDLPKSALGLLNILLSLDPAYRRSAGSALQHEFFHTSPLACDLSGLPVIAVEDDNETQTERRKHRRSRPKQRSRTAKEHQRKDEATENLDVGESTALKEEGESNSSVVVQSQETVVPATGPFSTTRPSPKREENSRRLPSSPEAAYGMYMTEGHPNASMNIKNRPPLPSAKRVSAKYNGIDGYMFGSNQVQRSASTREFREPDLRNFHKLDDLVDD